MRQQILLDIRFCTVKPLNHMDVSAGGRWKTYIVLKSTSTIRELQQKTATERSVARRRCTADALWPGSMFIIQQIRG